MPRKGLFGTGGLLGVLGVGGDRRRAVEAEAGGDYLSAAQAYSACGDRTKVAEMNLLLSERARTPDEKLEALREAARFTDEDDAAAGRVRGRIARALLGWVRARGGVITDGDRAVLGDAAALFLAAGDAAGAGACHELLGAPVAAAAAYQRAGDVDRLEQLLSGEADKRRRAVAVGDAVEEHRMRLRAGDVAGALDALAGALDAADAKDRAGLQRLHDELAARRAGDGRLRLRCGSSRLIVAAAPIAIGRGEGCALTLRDPGVSRRHVELRFADGAWQIVDLGAKNGTALAGARIADAVPAPPDGELAIGDSCALRVTAQGEQLTLTIVRGLDPGLRLLAAPGAIAATTDDGGALASVRFIDGRPRVAPAGRTLYRNGAAIGKEVEPLVGDVLEVGGERWEVEP